MKFKVGDAVKVVSVSGHSDIKKAIGMIGMIKYTSAFKFNPNRLVKKNFCYHVEYVFPIECSCSKCEKLPEEKRDYWHSEKFAEDELKLYVIK